MNYRPQDRSYKPTIANTKLHDYRRRFIRTVSVGTAAVLLSMVGAYTSIAMADSPQTSAAIVISEVQTSGCISLEAAICSEDPKKEFIELYNQTAATIDLNGWIVKYQSASGSTVIPLTTLSGSLGGHGSLLLAHVGYYEELANVTFGGADDSGKLAKSGGHIQIDNAAGELQDKIGWGSAAAPLIKSASAPAAGKSLKRAFPIDASNGLASRLNNTGNNYDDFTVSDTPSPKNEAYLAAPQPVETPPNTPTPIPTPDTTSPEIQPNNPTPDCVGVIISEVVPNPAGSDSGLEYIELHNPTSEIVQLSGCSLQSSLSTKAYPLPAIGLQPNEYKAFYDGETTVTLPNAAGGTVWLLSSTDELDKIVYPASMPEDTAWTLVDGMWQQSYMPTPNKANAWVALAPCPTGQERNPETNRCINMGTEEDLTKTVDDSNTAGLIACKVGQERNPETNRCRNVASAATQLVACKTGQTRNPETNRCVAATAAASATTADCKAGQERNPETNRCRAIATTSAVKACPAGQERNPETGRCKKSVAAAASTNKVEDVKSPSDEGYIRWLLPVVAIAGAIAYALYEWRQEITQRVRRLLGKDDYQLTAA